MVEDRLERGNPGKGYRRLRRLLAAVLAVACAGALAEGCLQGAASGASGGSALGGSGQSSPGGSKAGNPFARRAMWIWELPQVGGGNLASIIATAHRYGVGTLMIKSSDGTTFWSSQFSHQLVAALHAGGLKVCAWQYVYGNHPVTEAYMGADAVHDGADCLLIDAETEYQSKYVAAQTYIQRLRRLIGSRFRLALAGFPYIDYHPGFPYSVFLGPGGAQYNVPQMYWRDIGTTVDAVFAHTYSYNLIYGRPIFPLGQIYNSPPARQIIRFRQLSRVYGAPNVSWWDWQDASPGQWSALSCSAGSVSGYVASDPRASIGEGAQGDLVVWAQEHLVTAGYPIPIDGSFDQTTLAVVEEFQAAHALTVDGIVGPDTWTALLHYAPANVVWGAAGTPRRPALARDAPARADQRVLHEPVPRSASLPERRDELAGAGGAAGGADQSSPFSRA